jgi:hypothetical protein
MGQRHSSVAIVAASWMLGAVAIGVPNVASGQSTGSFEDLTESLVPGTQTITDTAGTTYTVNVTSLSTNSVGGVVASGTIVPPGGPLVPFTSNETTEEGGSSSTETITGTYGSTPFTCTFNTSTGTLLSGPTACGLIIFGETLGPGPSMATQTAATATTAAQGIVRSQAQTVVTIVSDRVRSISRDIARSFTPGPLGQAPKASFRGISAGSADAVWGVWGDASGAFLKNNTAIGYQGNSVVALTGFDYLYEKAWLGGFTAGYVHGDLSLKSTGGPRVSDGAVLGPYVSYIISPNASIDGQFQYTRLSNSVSAPLAGLNASFGSNRFTGSVNLNAYHDEGPWKLTGFTGYAYSWEGAENSILNNVPPYSSTTRYGAWKVGGEAGYLVMPELEAYVPATLRVETTEPRDLTSRVSLEVGAGLRYQLVDNIKAGLSATTTEIKTHWRDIRVGANLRWTF